MKLVAVDDAVLARLVQAAVADAAADEVTAPVSSGDGWTNERIAWLESFHRDRRHGFDAGLREVTWAVVVDGAVLGSLRLQRSSDDQAAEIGVWLTRSARGRGLGAQVVNAALAEARIRGIAVVRASTTAANDAAVAVLRSLGFEVSSDGLTVTARIEL